MRTAYGRPVADEATARGAQALLAAVSDAGRLVPWARPNAVVLEDAEAPSGYSSMSELCLSALATPSPDDASSRTPLLRFINPDVEPLPLLEAVVFEKRSATARCERCESNAGGRHRLLVPMGASVVAVHLCFHCRHALDDRYGCGLVWG